MSSTKFFTALRNTHLLVRKRNFYSQQILFHYFCARERLENVQYEYYVCEKQQK